VPRVTRERAPALRCAAATSAALPASPARQRAPQAAAAAAAGRYYLPRPLLQRRPRRARRRVPPAPPPPRRPPATLLRAARAAPRTHRSHAGLFVRRWSTSRRPRPCACAPSASQGWRRPSTVRVKSSDKSASAAADPRPRPGARGAGAQRGRARAAGVPFCAMSAGTLEGGRLSYDITAEHLQARPGLPARPGAIAARGRCCALWRLRTVRRRRAPPLGPPRGGALRYLAREACAPLSCPHIVRRAQALCANIGECADRLSDPAWRPVDSGADGDN
jgi:hypothetical protein